MTFDSFNPALWYQTASLMLSISMYSVSPKVPDIDPYWLVSLNLK
jgi:hypothetical protein